MRIEDQKSSEEEFDWGSWNREQQALQQAATPEPPKRTLYVFLDESGNFDFSAKGTDHFVMAAVYTEFPCDTAAPLQALKYELMADRSPQLEFHATENSRGTRKRVADVIRTLSPYMKVKSFYVDKHFAHPSMQTPVAMLDLFGMAFARWIVAGVAEPYDQVILMFDSVLTGKQRDAFQKAIKPKLKSLRKPFHVVFHPVKSDLNGQIADYFAWSLFRREEHQDHEPLKALSPIQPDSFNLFQKGYKKYY